MAGQRGVVGIEGHGEGLSYRIWDMTQDRKTGNFFRAGRKMQVQK